MYNANINLFGSVVLLFERSGNGAFEPFVKIYPLRLFDFIDGKGYILVGVYVAFLVVLVYKWYRVSRDLVIATVTTVLTLICLHARLYCERYRRGCVTYQ